MFRFYDSKVVCSCFRIVYPTPKWTHLKKFSFTHTAVGQNQFHVVERNRFNLAMRNWYGYYRTHWRLIFSLSCTCKGVSKGYSKNNTRWGLSKCQFQAVIWANLRQLAHRKAISIPISFKTFCFSALCLGICGCSIASGREMKMSISDKRLDATRIIQKELKFLYHPYRVFLEKFLKKLIFQTG